MDRFNCRSTILGSCVKYAGATLDTEDCDLTICTGEYYDDILADVYEKICTLSSKSCMVMVSASDVCCNYLQGKITSLDETLTIERNTDDLSGCETLDFSVNIGVNNIILYNDWANQNATEDLKSYAVPAGTLVENGDELVVSGSLVWNSGTPEVRFYFGSNAISPFIFLATGTEQSALFEVRIVRLSSTTVRAMAILTYFDGSNLMSAISRSVSNNITVSNLDTTSTTLKFAGDASATVTEQFLSVKLNKLVS